MLLVSCETAEFFVYKAFADQDISLSFEIQFFVCGVMLSSAFMTVATPNLEDFQRFKASRTIAMFTVEMAAH